MNELYANIFASVFLMFFVVVVIFNKNFRYCSLVCFQSWSGGPKDL